MESDEEFCRLSEALRTAGMCDGPREATEVLAAVLQLQKQEAEKQRQEAQIALKQEQFARRLRSYRREARRRMMMEHQFH